MVTEAKKREVKPPLDHIEGMRRLIRGIRWKIQEELVKKGRAKKLGIKIDNLIFHQLNTTLLAWRLGKEIKLARGDLRILIFTALVHDIGKLSIPSAILEKEGSLNESERKIMERHPALGAEIFKKIGLSKIAKIILHHHEWWNGSGYPNSHAGDANPLLARIIQLCDAWDSMRNRDHRRSQNGNGNGRLAKDKSFGEIAKMAGIQFDPEIVAKFTPIMQE